jgi:myo-inositol 2-dehydrogenase/D-chiro-inositol 1-dehydrogenase
MRDVLRLGLIGAGRIGQVHAATITQRVTTARLVAVADVNRAAAQACADQHRVPKATDDPYELLDDPGIEAVLICSSTDTHAPFIEAAARAGKHIFCEKPIALDLDATAHALGAVERAGVKLQIGFNRRFDANFVRARRAVETGEIGEPHILHLISRDPAPPPIDYVKVSGGLFLDMSIHDFDMARYLIGSEVEEVHALGAARVDPTIGEAGDVDTAVILLRFANGVFGTIDNSRRAAYGYDQRAEIFGSRGAVSVLNNYPNNTVLSTGHAVYRDLPLNFFMQRYVESYQREIEAFVRAIVEDTAVEVSGHDGWAALAIAIAAKRSWQEGRPVKVSEAVPVSTSHWMSEGQP